MIIVFSVSALHNTSQEVSHWPEYFGDNVDKSGQV
jgi:hypothetical protein